MRAIVVNNLGDPELLQLAGAPRPEPAAGQVLVRLHTVGVNFSDTERRRGPEAWAAARQDLMRSC